MPGRPAHRCLDVRRAGGPHDRDRLTRIRVFGPVVPIARDDVAIGQQRPVGERCRQLAERSLGTYMILDHVRRAERLGLSYLYLGYWVQGSRKMNYKSRFLPQERLTADGWVKATNSDRP